MDTPIWACFMNKGLGVNKDPAMALSLFSEAAKRGSPEGMYRVGLAYFDGLGVQKDLTTACQWFIRAAADNHPYAEGQAGVCYYNGTGVAQNHETAFNWFVLAGQAGLLMDGFPSPTCSTAAMVITRTAPPP